MKGENNNNMCYRLTALRQSLVFHKFMSLLSCASTIQQIINLHLFLCKDDMKNIKNLSKKLLKRPIYKGLSHIVSFKVSPNNIYIRGRIKGCF